MDGLSPEDRAFEAFLRRRAAPGARKSFREGLREAFLAGHEPGKESTSRAEAGDRTAPVVFQELETQLRRTPLAPQAREGFREELRRRFTTGDLPAAEPIAGKAPAWGGGRLLRFVVPLAAAAAVVAVTFLLPDDAGWRVRVQGRAPVEVTGLRLDARELGRIGVELSRGGTLATGPNTVQLTLEDRLRVDVRPETRITLAALPSEGGGSLRMELEEGEAFLSTLDGHTGEDLWVETPDATVHVTGTALGVLSSDDGTCVCVAEGEVEVTRADGGVVTVDARQSYLVYREEGRSPQQAPFGAEPGHTGPLLDFVAGL